MRIHTDRETHRAWLYIGQLVLSLEATRNKNDFCHATVAFGDDRNFTLALALPKVFAVWFGIELPFSWSKRLRRLTRSPNWPRETGVLIQNGKLQLEFRVDSGASFNRMYAPRRTPLEVLRGEAKNRSEQRAERRDIKNVPWWDRWRYRGWSFEHGWELSIQLDPRDKLFGHRQKLSERTVKEVNTVVPMPEGNYPCHVKLMEITVGRPHWFTRSRFNIGDTTMAIPIPTPGKGENSWDCEDDHVAGQYGQAGSVGDAVQKMAASAIEKRERYARLDWVPSIGWPEGVGR